MTQDEIIEMARQAGIEFSEERIPETGFEYQGSMIVLNDLETFAKLVFEKGFFAGFEASGEGFNGEYPYGDKNIDITTDEYVLHALKEARGQE